MQHKIRLAGIDAPEKRQAFGNVSKQNLARMGFNREVTVEYDKRDGHGRIVGKVFVDGNDICIRQIEEGLAWHTAGEASYASGRSVYHNRRSAQ
jgi:endonuclease YncB( thermonuclease family)